MRWIPGLFLLLSMLGAVSGRALADPMGVEPKDWHVRLDPSRATYPEQEPNDTCGDGAQQVELGDCVNPASLVPGDADWYRLTMYLGHAAMFGTDGVNSGDATDTYIELYAEDCATVLAADDDSGPGLYSLIDGFVVPYSGTYYLKVRGYSDSTAGPYQAFFIWVDIPPPPPYDTCDGAIEIPECSSGTIEGSMDGTRNDYDPAIPGPSCTGYPAAGKDLVYVIHASCGATMGFRYRQLEADASMYLVTDCADISGTCVAGADATGAGDFESIDYTPSDAGTYYLVLDAYGTNAGRTWTLDYSVACPTPEACCLPDGRCIMDCVQRCRAMGGTPMGAGVTCNPDPCEATPVQSGSWGRIRSAYR